MLIAYIVLYQNYILILILILKYLYFQSNSNQFLTYRTTIPPINNQNPTDQNCRKIQKNLQIESKPQYPTRHETREEFL